jgi:hypothetical protein
MFIITLLIDFAIFFGLTLTILYYTLLLLLTLLFLLFDFEYDFLNFVLYFFTGLNFLLLLINTQRFHLLFYSKFILVPFT